MKKTIRLFAVLLFALTILSTVSICVSAKEIDFDKYIAEYEPSFYSDLVLEVGETDKPTASVWVEHGSGEVYSSNTNIVTVGKNGTVTAVGEGTAYVVYLGIGTMHEVYRFTVISNDTPSVAPSEESVTTPENNTAEPSKDSADNNSTPASENTVNWNELKEMYVHDEFSDIKLSIGETNTPGSALWIKSGAKAYSSDENVVTVSKNGTVTAVSEGTAYVAYVPPVESASKVYKVIVVKEENNSDEKLMAGLSAAYLGLQFNPLMWILPIIAYSFFFIVLGLMIYIICSVNSLSSKTMGRKELPQRTETPNTIRTAVATSAFCPKCGAAFGEGGFCASCGTPKQAKNVYVVPINGRMTAQDFEKHINQWFAENPYIYNCNLKLDTHASLFIPFVQKKFFVKSAVLEFNVADKPQKHQYGFAFLYKFRLFGPIGYSYEKQVEEWKANNPDCTVISTKGGRIQHFGTQSGFYAQYYNHVLFKK